ncbi:hypothetical protein DNTS_034799 [Danionella cerebrum]|uniref:CST complex subunit STN1 n=1 Tax=Danionella cerebrum TaxID=2873325 RepID=A0A553NRL6_9TELE|nr:hypothetical protein DNTS_034799 [Danionella translucida]
MAAHTGDMEVSPEEPPSLLWGLDPVFSVYARLYISDILQMKESRQVPGVYFYKARPISEVDVMGTVVYKREREDFYCYGVDDSTGVINCLCWNDETLLNREDSTSRRVINGTSDKFDIEEELRLLKEAEREGKMLEIGDLMRVQGTLQTSKGAREIKSSFFHKVHDPVMAQQISHMLELPQMYRKCYDQPVQIPTDDLDITETFGLLSQSVASLKEFFTDRAVSRFRPCDVEYLLHPLIKKSSTEEEEDGPRKSFGTQLQELLKETLRFLVNKGQIFRKELSQDEVYHVTEQDKDLHAAIRNVVLEDCKREKYAEKGCHVLHILSSVRQRYSQNLSLEVLEVALMRLEDFSDVISSLENYYTIF